MASVVRSISMPCRCPQDARARPSRRYDAEFKHLQLLGEDLALRMAASAQPMVATLQVRRSGHLAWLQPPLRCQQFNAR